MAKATPLELTDEQVTIIQSWQLHKGQLEAVKTDELNARLTAIKSLPFSEDKEDGTQTLKLNAGWTLKAIKALNFTADKDVSKVVAGLEALGAVNPGAAAELVRWEAVISSGAYKKLSEDEQRLVAGFISIKPGTPQLELKPPAAAKG